eukprot:2465032-Prymnesium_polylepis.1
MTPVAVSHPPLPRGRVGRRAGWGPGRLAAVDAAEGGGPSDRPFTQTGQYRRATAAVRAQGCAGCVASAHVLPRGARGTVTGEHACPKKPVVAGIGIRVVAENGIRVVAGGCAEVVP